MKLSLLVLFSALSTATALIDTIPTVQESYEYMDMVIKTYKETLVGDQYTEHYRSDSWRETAVSVITNSDQKYIMASFYGTDDVNDFISDIRIRKVDFGPPSDPINEDVGVHKGFNKVLWKRNANSDYLYDEVKAAIEALIAQYPDWKIVITGHSLGAAVGQLMAVALAVEMPNKDIYAFGHGCPRVGNDDWIAWVNGFDNLAVWRHVNNNDIVPRIPPEAFNFHHPGHTVQFRDDGAKAYYLHTGDESQGYVGVPDGWGRGKNVNEHFGTSYMEYMDKALNDPETWYFDSFETFASTEFDLPEIPSEPRSTGVSDVAEVAQKRALRSA